MIRAGTQMRHVTLTLMRDDLPRASLALAELEAFAPDDRPLLESELPEIPGVAFRDRIRRAWGYLDRLSSIMGELPKDREPLPSLAISREQVVEVEQWLKNAWEQCAPCDALVHKVEDEYRELENLESSLADFADLDIDLGRLQSDRGHLDLRLGSIPADNLTRLREVLALSNHLILNIAGEGDTLRILVAGSRDAAETLDSVLLAAAFQPLHIPESFDSNPEALRQELALKRQELDEVTEAMQLRIENWRGTNRDEVRRAVQLLEAAEPYVNLQGAARSRGALAVLMGWAPAQRIGRSGRTVWPVLRHTVP